MQYGKIINGNLILAPYKKDMPDGTCILGYNFDSNAETLKKDGYYPIVVIEDKGQYTDCEGFYTFDFKVENNKIVEYPIYHKYSYSRLRRNSYPPIEDYLDAQVKINSGVPSLIKEGKEQLLRYFDNCLDVKEKYPKE